MKFALAMIPVFAGVAPALSAQDAPEAAAEHAARVWLAQVDAGDYAESWDSAAAAFQAAVTQEAWHDTMRQVRQPLGALERRELLGAQYTSELPGAPEGEYVVLQFPAVFANRPNAVETVVPMKNPDGSWRVSGYFIR